MIRKDALAELIARVEAGALNVNNRHWLSVLPPHTWDCAWHAYNGSLDAAKALHEAVLPGWEYAIYSPADSYALFQVQLETPEMRKEFAGGMISGEKDNPARAWLLAILRALHSMVPDT